MVLALPVVLVGAALMLLYFAARPLFEPFLRQLASFISAIPGVNWNQAIIGTVASLPGMIFDWVNAGIGGVTELIVAPITGIQMFANAATQSITGLFAQIYVLSENVARPFADLARTVAQVVARIATNEARANVLTVTVTALGAAIATIVAHTIPGAKAEAVAQAGAYTQTAVNTEAQRLVRAIQIVGADARHAVESEATRAARAEAAVVTHAGQLVNAEHERAIAAEKVIAAKAGASIEGLTDTVQQLVGEVAPIAAAGVVAKVVSLTTELTQLRRDCIDPTCSILPELQAFVGLLDAVAIAELVAVVAEAIHDPRGAAASVAGEAMAFRELANGITSPLFGVTV